MGVYERYKEQGTLSPVSTNTQPTLSPYQRYIQSSGITPKPVEKKRNVVTEFFTNLFDIYRTTPEKFKSTIRQSAEDIQKGEVAKGIAKAGFRTAGDALIAVFAPFSAAIGAVLNKTGGQKIIDDLGNIIADSSGITDLPNFQRFAINHPNAEQDFDRALFLLLAAGEKGQIKPDKQAQEAVRTFTEKITQPKQPTADPLLTETRKMGEPTQVETRQAPRTQQRTSRPVESTEFSQTNLKFRERVVEEGLLSEFPELQKIERMSMRENIQRATKLVEENPQQALDIVMEQRPNIVGLRNEFIYKALEEHAIRTGDVNMIQGLLKSNIGTEAGQTLKALDVPAGEVSVVKSLKQLRTVREESFTKQTGKTVEQAKVEYKKTAEKVRLPDTAAWKEFLKSIEC